MDTKNIDLRTYAQIDRDERHARVCSNFLALYKEHPEVSPYRLCQAVAEQERMTPFGVRIILIKKGIYIPNGYDPIMNPNAEYNKQ